MAFDLDDEELKATRELLKVNEKKINFKNNKDKEDDINDKKNR